LWHNFSQSMAWHKCQPIVPGFQRELTTNVLQLGISRKLCCKNELTFSFAVVVQLAARFYADD
jgi:hypothetical protein